MKKSYLLISFFLCCFLVSSAKSPVAVDLGLPSGTKWASCNVGATEPWGYGGYYAWGETGEKEDYSWSTYKYCNGSFYIMTKYSYRDNKTILEAEDDVATVKWGDAWRMPTSDEQKELIDNCTWEWSTLNGVNGYQVTGPNGNSIFLPAAGFRNGQELVGQGDYGLYWLASLDSDSPGSGFSLFFFDLSYDYGRNDRSYGHTVRPVSAK